MILLWFICSNLLSASTLHAATLTRQVELADSHELSVSKQKDYSGIVVWLEPQGQSTQSVKPGNFSMLQKNKRFNPHVLVVPVGSNVEFPNSDPIFHNAF